MAAQTYLPTIGISCDEHESIHTYTLPNSPPSCAACGAPCTPRRFWRFLDTWHAQPSYEDCTRRANPQVALLLRCQLGIGALYGSLR